MFCLFVDKRNILIHTAIMNQVSEKEFKKLYKKLSINELAAYCDVHRMTVNRWARKFNLPHKTKPSLIKESKPKNKVK